MLSVGASVTLLVPVGLAPLAKRCTMWEMREVTALWDNFKPDVQYILDTEGVRSWLAVRSYQCSAKGDVVSLTLRTGSEYTLKVMAIHHGSWHGQTISLDN